MTALLEYLDAVQDERQSVTKGLLGVKLHATKITVVF